MRNDYLWDGSGEPDPEVQRLERLLSDFRSHRAAPELPGGDGWMGARPRWTAIAAAVAVAAAGLWLLHTAPQQNGADTWQVARNGAEQSRLAVGQTLATGAGYATVSGAGIGTIEVEPNSLLRVVRARRNEHRMSLERGTIHARIWAAPRSFVVDTPSAVATDLGCFYTLHVADDGSGLVTVEAGWVSFERNGREVFVPAGAACQTRPRLGPGTPYRENASPALRQAIEDFDLGHATGTALSVMLSEARPEDAFTLWHLLPRAAAPDAARIYDKLAALVAPPAGVTRDGVLHGDRPMLDLWWDALGLGDTKWWRQHQGSLP